MPVIARVIARALPNISFKPAEAETFKEFALFCGTGLLALLLLITQDLDIGTRFF